MLLGMGKTPGNRRNYQQNQSLTQNNLQILMLGFPEIVGFRSSKKNMQKPKNFDGSTQKPNRIIVANEGWNLEPLQLDCKAAARSWQPQCRRSAARLINQHQRHRIAHHVHRAGRGRALRCQADHLRVEPPAPSCSGPKMSSKPASI